MKIVTGREMAEIDKYTIENIGVPGPVLMENAARAVCRIFESHIGTGEKPAVAIICGTGNNGGDGFCIARILSGWGYTVFPILVGRIQSLKEDALLNYNLLKNYGINIINVLEDLDISILETTLEKCTWIIDALFGTGLSRPIVGIAGKVLKYCSKISKRVLAVDIPSGVNSDTGEVLGDVMKAELTVTFGLPKWGHFLFPGANYRGKLVVADIGFPQKVLDDDKYRANLTTAEYVRKFLPTRALNAHKGDCGKLGIIAGCRHYLGAAILSSKSALRMGTGYVTLYLPNFLEPVTKIAMPDVVTNGLTDMEGGFITTQASDALIGLIRDKDAIAIGPGLSRMPTTKDFVIDVLEENILPAIIDADGLNNLAGYDGLQRNPEVPWIMTPHPGEAARLLNRPTREIIANPIGAAEELTQRYKAVIVMKGAHTIIMNTDKTIFVNPTGNPGMATMGMGDVLTGIISALVAQGVPPFPAAVSGVYIHGLAGDLAAKELGEESITASDLVERIPTALRMLRAGEIREKVEFFH